MEPTLELVRFAYLDEGTLGRLYLPSGLTLFTIERPWQNNEPFVSCVPEGVYELEWDTTGRIKNVPRLRDTEPRTQINIHAANYAHELHGCIAPGLDWSIDGKSPMVSDSGAAMSLLLEQFDTVDLLDMESLVLKDGRQAILGISSADTTVL